MARQPAHNKRRHETRALHTVIPAAHLHTTRTIHHHELVNKLHNLAAPHTLSALILQRRQRQLRRQHGVHVSDSLKRALHALRTQRARRHNRVQRVLFRAPHALLLARHLLHWAKQSSETMPRLTHATNARESRAKRTPVTQLHAQVGAASASTIVRECRILVGHQVKEITVIVIVFTVVCDHLLRPQVQIHGQHDR